MDNIIAYIFTNHKDIMEYLFAHYDIKYVENSMVGDSKFCKYHNGKIVFQPYERTLFFSEIIWKYGNKIPDEDSMTYITIGDFGNLPDIIGELINKYGGCAKDKEDLILYKLIDKVSARKLLEKGF